MERVEVSVEVRAIDAPTVERLKSAGHVVYRGKRTWRVEMTLPVLGPSSVRAQAHVAARQLVRDFGLTPASDPIAVSLRDPDSMEAAAASAEVLSEARRAWDPEPIPRPRRRWWQRAMELGLGERKGD